MAQSRADERMEALVAIWTDRLRCAVDAKRDFDEAAREVDDLFTGEPDPFFKSDGVAEVLDVEHLFLVTVNLPFQIRSWLGPNLYQRNPTRTVTSRTKDSILAGLGSVVSAWLNYTPAETGLADESRLAVDEALIDGRSSHYTGYDATTGLISSRYVSIADVLIDPDAKRPKDAYWIALRRQLPRWELEREFGKVVKELPEGVGYSDSIAEGSDHDDKGKPREHSEEDEETDLVTIYEIWSRMGTGWRGAGVEEPGDDSFDYKKIVLVDGWGEKPLYLGRWETPLYVDGVWPLTFLDLTPTKNSLYPVSLLKAALPSLRAVNLLASAALKKALDHAREIYFVQAGLSEDAKNQIAQGGMSEVVELKSTDPGVKASDLVQHWQAGAISPEVREQINFHLGQIGEVTGLLPILKGQSNEQQIRSATEADIQDRNARSRLQDMSERVEDWATRVARNEGLLCRLELTADEVSRYLDASVDLELGYRIIVPVYGVALPTRLYAPGSEVDKEKEEPCVQGLAPSFARYYESPDEAAQAAVKLMQSLPQLEAAYLQRTGKPVFVDRDPATQLPKINVERVTVKDVWTDTAYLSPVDLARELSFRIEAGSTKRPDANKKIDQANTLMASVGQPALQLGDFATYNRVLTALYESQGTPQNMRILLTPPPPPEPAPPGAAPPPKGAPKQ